MEKKYKTVPEGAMLRIIALKDFADVKKGDRGGLIDKEENLSQEGNCWVYGSAGIHGDAVIFENAKIYGHAQVGGDAKVHDNAQIFGGALVYDNAEVCDNAVVCGKTKIGDFPKLYGDALVSRNAQVYDNTRVGGNAKISWDVEVSEKAKISGNVKLWSTMKSLIDTPIENRKDYIIFTVEKDFYIIPLSSYIGRLVAEDIYYVKNIQIIRQIYGEKI